MADGEGSAPSEEYDGASPSERLIGAAKRAQMELFEEAVADPAGVDLNAKDGLGNTALHYAYVKNAIFFVYLTPSS